MADVVIYLKCSNTLIKSRDYKLVIPGAPCIENSAQVRDWSSGLVLYGRKENVTHSGCPVPTIPLPTNPLPSAHSRWLLIKIQYQQPCLAPLRHRMGHRFVIQDTMGRTHGHGVTHALYPRAIRVMQSQQPSWLRDLISQALRFPQQIIYQLRSIH